MADELGWTTNARGVVVYNTNEKPILITHENFRVIFRDWLEKFPEENPRENIRQELLRSKSIQDQELAKFRDIIKVFVKKMLNDPELLTLAAKIIHRMQ